MTLEGNRSCQTTAIPTSCPPGTTEGEPRHNRAKGPQELGFLLGRNSGKIIEKAPCFPPKPGFRDLSAKRKFLAVKKGKQAYTGPLQFLASRPPISVPRQNACRAAVQAYTPNEIAERGSGHPESFRFPALAWKIISRLTIRARSRTSRIRSRPFPPACSPALPLSFPKHPSPPRICPGIPDRQSFSP